jgi:hypothetical protein
LTALAAALLTAFFIFILLPALAVLVLLVLLPALTALTALLTTLLVALTALLSALTALLILVLVFVVSHLQLLWLNMQNPRVRSKFRLQKILHCGRGDCASAGSCGVDESTVYGCRRISVGQKVASLTSVSIGSTRAFGGGL